MIKRGFAVSMLLAVCPLLFMLVSVTRFLFSEQIGVLSFYPFLYAGAACACAFAASKLKPRLCLAALVTLSFAAALIAALWTQTEPVSDFKLLYSLADALKNGDLDTLRNSRYLTIWAYQSFFVIYQAAVLRVLPFGITPLLVMNALFMSGITALIYLLTRRSYGDRAAGFIAAAYLLYPAPYFLAPVLTNQHISMFFILLGVYMLAGNNVLAGVFLAAGNAFRPDGTIVAAALTAFALIKVIREGIKKEALRPLTAVACYAVTGLIISAAVTLSGVNPNGLKNLDPLWKFTIGLNAPTNGGYSDELAAAVYRAGDIPERRELELEIIRQHLSADKRTLFSFLTVKAYTAWKSYEDVDWAFGGQYERNVPFINRPLRTVLLALEQAERLLFAAAVSLSAVSLLILLRRGRADSLTLLCALVTALVFAAYLFIEIQPRYRYFLYPFLFIMTGPALRRLYEYKRPVVRRFPRRHK